MVNNLCIESSWYYEKRVENIFEKIKHENKDFLSQKRDWENFEQNNESIAFNVLFSSKDSEEITLLYKLELYSSEWLRSKKESITDEDSCFQNNLNDSLDYQTIKTHPERISKLKAYNNQYN